MKIVDADVTETDRLPAALDVSGDGDTHASPGLRPEVLADAAQRQTKALIHAALFKGPGEASTIGPYQVLKLLGEGGMGVVYAAYDDKLERKVALKLIRGAAMRRPEGRARTLREARALARLSHPNVVHVYQVGEVDDEIYVAMEFLTGPTLRAWLAAKPRTWREVLAVFRQAGEGLAAAHREGVIHRDFKPANVIVGDDGRVRVLDFGLAHFFGQGGAENELKALPVAGEITDVLLTQTGAVLGTPAYMAAEQFAGARGDAKTDQFSFCTALYEALYGQRPFVADKLDALVSAVRGGRVDPVKIRRNVPQWLHRVVMRGLRADPAARWPSMDALLVALAAPAVRVDWGRIVGATAAVAALLIGGLGYVYALELPPPPAPPVAQDEAAMERAAVVGSQDAHILAEARAMATSDPLASLRKLSALGGDEPRTWQRARFLSNVAEVRGLPTQELRFGDRPLLDVQPLAGGGLIGRDDLGAVDRWDLSKKTAWQTLPEGSATQLVVARDVPVWAAISGRTVRVFGADWERTIDVGEPPYSQWRLASDGRTLIAQAQTAPTTTRSWVATVYLWDLTGPDAAPRTIELPPETLPVIADDASLVLTREAKGIRVLRPREGGDRLLKYRGQAWALSADRRFIVARPSDKDGALDVLEVATGKTRRVQAEEVTALAGDEVLFTRTSHGRPSLRRESLATGKVAWSLALTNHAGPHARRLVVDPANEQFAVATGDAWAVGDLRRGALTSFVTVPKDSSPRWIGAGALMVVVGNELRIHDPAASPVQLRHDGAGCGMSPGGRYAVVQPHDGEHGEYTRVELATGEATQFRCPSAPDPAGRYPGTGVSSLVDDTGQVALFGAAGWNCWWDEQHGARTGSHTLAGGRIIELPRGVALVGGSEVEVWSGPEDRAQRWTVAGAPVDIVASPSGERLAVRSEHGVQVLHVETGAVMPVNPFSTPAGTAALRASALAWSPDGARLAVLDKLETSLELSVWDVTGAPREVGPANHVTLGGLVLEDSPGAPRNQMTFTPSGAAVALTHRLGSLMLVDLATHETRTLEVPEHIGLFMRSETDVVGIDLRYTPFMADLAAREVSPLTPDLEIGGSTRPRMQHSENGSLWTCAALGPGTLIEIAPLDQSTPSELRTRLIDRVMSL